MALGIDTNDALLPLPIIKFDTQHARFLRVDVLDRRRTYVDITNVFSAAFDMPGIEVGWMRFGHGTLPDMRLVKVGLPLPEAPSPLHRKGVRVVLHLSTECGGDTRELCSTSIGFLRAFDKLHDEWLKQAADHPGQLPLIELTGFPDLTGRFPEPLFAIHGWTDPARTLDEVA